MEKRVGPKMSPSPGNPAPPIYPTVSQGLPTLLVMIAVLAIILLFCFWAAPGVRDFCRRSICCHCPMDEPDAEQGIQSGGRNTATPTIILLPFGRMLVVDRSVFEQFHVDQTGIDFMELSANIIRAHQLQYGSTPSILDSETSKGISPTSLGLSPPAYEDIFGDLPPSYSELSLMFQPNTEITEQQTESFQNKRNLEETLASIAPSSSTNHHHQDLSNCPQTVAETASGKCERKRKGRPRDLQLKESNL